MANRLQENDPSLIKEEGRDVNVINKELSIEVGKGSKVFEIVLWCLLILPGLIFLIMKVKAKNYFDQLEQQLQVAASEIDNYMEQRVIVLEGTASLVNKSVNLDKETMTLIAKYRSGVKETNGAELSEISNNIDTISRNINCCFGTLSWLKSAPSNSWSNAKEWLFTKNHYSCKNKLQQFN